MEPVAGGVAIHNLADGPAAALAPCPSKPNCVTSVQHEGMSESDVLKPFKGYAKIPQNRDQILKTLLLDQATLITNNEAYIHATYTSKIFGFVDDVEFYFPTDEVIHFRSASRSGYFDFGVNRKRIEMLRFRYDQRE